MGGRVAGKRALVWGGGTGIGLACARAIAAEGGAVLIAGRRQEVLSRAAADLGVFWEAGDATDPVAVAAVTAAAIDRLGGLDTLVVSAGAGGVTATGSTDPGRFQSILDQNLRPPFLTAQAALPALRAAGQGAVIVISSIYGLVGQRERVAYCTAKAGVIGMVRAMALDLAAEGIRVNAICPGFVETELALAVAAEAPDPAAALRDRRGMHPIPRSGRPEEIGALAVYLASDAAAFTTGQAIAVDGGYTAR
jgi:meso-butanediol dehydrogenase/(S,S)-butanediol dehydrogenase/diacetyl reductase